jgi:hypothetical protein
MDLKLEKIMKNVFFRSIFMEEISFVRECSEVMFNKKGIGNSIGTQSSIQSIASHH